MRQAIDLLAALSLLFVFSVGLGFLAHAVWEQPKEPLQPLMLHQQRKAPTDKLSMFKSVQAQEPQ